MSGTRDSILARLRAGAPVSGEQLARELGAEGDHAVFSVADDGPGIPAATSADAPVQPFL